MEEGCVGEDAGGMVIGHVEVAGAITERSGGGGGGRGAEGWKPT